jgi:aspartate kinase
LILRILKFGGSSLAGIDLIEAAAERVHRVVDAGVRPVVVVSAVSGTTNRLLSAARRIHAEPSGSELDRLLATGEMQSAALLAIALAKRGLRARSLSGGEAGIVTDDDFGRARILELNTAPVAAALEAGEVPIVAGFQGMTSDGRVTTIGRGGTDITAAALGVHLEADRIVYYRDADGIYSVDPKLLPVYGKRIDRLDYESMIDLAEAGVPILHPQALELARAHGLELELRSFRESGGGTFVGEGPFPSPLPVWSVCLSPPICLLTLEGLEAETPSLARLTALLDRTDLPLDAAIHHGGRKLCLTIQAPDLDGPILKRQVEDFLREEARVSILLERNRRRVTIVGKGVCGRKASTAVEQAGAKLGPPLFTFTGTRHRAFVVPDAEGSSWVTSLYQTLLKP